MFIFTIQDFKHYKKNINKTQKKKQCDILNINRKKNSQLPIRL